LKRRLVGLVLEDCAEVPPVGSPVTLGDSGDSGEAVGELTASQRAR